MQTGLNIQSAHFSLQKKLHDMYCTVYRLSELMLFAEFKFDEEELI
jgi:hypothetical protein